MVVAIVTLTSFLTLWIKCETFVVPKSDRGITVLYSTNCDITNEPIIPESKKQNSLQSQEHSELYARTEAKVYAITTTIVPHCLQCFSEKEGISEHTISNSKPLLTNSSNTEEPFTKLQQKCKQNTQCRDKLKEQYASDHKHNSFTITNIAKGQHVGDKYVRSQFISESQPNMVTKQAVHNKDKVYTYSSHDFFSGSHDNIERREASFLGQRQTKNDARLAETLAGRDKRNTRLGKEKQLSDNQQDNEAHEHPEIFVARSDMDHHKKFNVLGVLYSLVSYAANDEYEQIRLVEDMNWPNSNIELNNYRKADVLGTLYSLVSYVANQKFEHNDEVKLHDTGYFEEQNTEKQMKQDVPTNSLNLISLTSQSENAKVVRQTEQLADNKMNDKTSSPLNENEGSGVITAFSGYLNSYGWRGYLILSASIVIFLTLLLFSASCLARAYSRQTNWKQLTMFKTSKHPAPL